MTKERDRALGMGAQITRKDFLNAAVLGVGASLLQTAAPLVALAAGKSESDPGLGNSPKGMDEWTGYGGVGDYAKSNGNTRPVLEAAHRLRDGQYAGTLSKAIDTGEQFDVIVVGGGISGLSAAYYLERATGGKRRCLLLENHPIFGGECKSNEFSVNGHRLVAPQGSNNLTIPKEGDGSLGDAFFTDMKIPRAFRFQEMDPSLKPIRFPMDNYATMDGHAENQLDIGYFFDAPGQSAAPGWVMNIWQKELEGTPFSPEVRQDLLKWRYASGYGTEAFQRFLDTMSYKDYIEKVMGLRPEVTKFIEPYTGLINGLSPDAVSAWAAHQIGHPGVGAKIRGRDAKPGISFPGGNATLARYFVKALAPSAIEGSSSFEDVTLGRIRFDKLDVRGSATRIRVGSTVVRVAHEGAGAAGSGVVVTYEKGGKVYRSRARAVVLACGGWVTKHAVEDLPGNIKGALQEFYHSPAMIVNVAVTNWRFLYRRGISAARWFANDFGFSCSMRRTMIVGDYGPPFHPDHPAVLTFYMGMYEAGYAAREQTVIGRTKLLSSSFADNERLCRQRLLTMFGDVGFDPHRDIAGIILNRWGHARLVQPPGWYFGRNGQPAPRQVVQKGFGRIAIAHSELNGHQNWTGAMAQSHRAVEQILALT